MMDAAVAKCNEVLQKCFIEGIQHYYVSWRCEHRCWPGAGAPADVPRQQRRATTVVAPAPLLWPMPPCSSVARVAAVVAGGGVGTWDCASSWRAERRGVSAASQEMLDSLAAAVDHDESRGGR